MSGLLSYETNQVVSITDWYVGLLYRLVQTSVLIYVIGYVIIYSGGYLETDNGVCNTFGKIKGISYLQQIVHDYDNNSSSFPSILDSVDTVMPSYGATKYFIMTSFGLTVNQSIGVCSSDLTCNANKDCPNNIPNNSSTGMFNGQCSDKFCQLVGWCPLESKESTKHYKIDVSKYTILIKNSVKFNKFNKNEVNIYTGMSKEFLENCRYNQSNESLLNCPIIPFSEIFSILKINETEMMQGVNVEISIDWECNYDFPSHQCKPTYKFFRNDVSSIIAPGYNFRCADRFRSIENNHLRDLYKCYGIGLEITCNSKAVRFSLIPLLLNVGSGLGLLGLATIFCDIVVYYLSPKRKHYRQLIVKSVDYLDESSDDTLN